MTPLYLINAAEDALAVAMLSDLPLEVAMDEAARRLQHAARHDEETTLIALQIMRHLEDVAESNTDLFISKMSREILERAKRVQDRPMSH